MAVTRLLSRPRVLPRLATTVASLAAGTLGWLLPLTDDAVGVTIRIVITLACLAGLLAAWVFPRGGDTGLMFLSAEIGVLVALATLSLFSVGILFLGAAAIVAFDLRMSADANGKHWYDGRHLFALVGALVLVEVALVLSIRSGG